YMIETFFGLARLGHTDGKGKPDLLQLALPAQEFRDVLVFRLASLFVRGGRGRAGLSRDVPAAFAHGAGVAEVALVRAISSATHRGTDRAGEWFRDISRIHARRRSDAA